MDEKKKQAHVQATVKYNSKNVKQIKINLNRKTDSDIINYLDKVVNVQGLIKTLIRNNMKNAKEVYEHDHH